MNNPTLEHTFDLCGLVRVGEITMVNDQLQFELTVVSKDVGFVYVWVEHSSDDSSVVYVGKAGNTLHVRCNQHTSGFRNSKTGQKHANRIRLGIRSGKRYFVYARKSQVSEVLGEINIPMESVEELALIRMFSPEWNALK